jgi:Neutral/alkaline non-lysosomal ceramidase, N-terminal
MRLAFAILMVVTAPLAAAPPLAVGFAEVDITPKLGEKPVYLAGFGMNRKATKVHDPIMARAVVLSDGTKTFAMVSVDLVGLFFHTVEGVRKQLPEFDHVLVSSTHNHEGPDTLGLWGPSPVVSGVDAAYMKQVDAGIVAAIRLANGQLRAASATIGHADGESLINDNRKPIVKHGDMIVLKFVGDDSKPLGLLVQWNNHPETLSDKNTELSADFVGYTVQALREKHRCPVAYFTGTVGGLMTSLRVEVKNAAGVSLPDGSFEKAELYGKRVANLANDAINRAAPVTLTPFEVRTKSLLLPVDNGLYKIGWQVGVFKRPLYRWTGDPTPATPTPSTDASQNAALRSEVGLLRLGELDIASIPGEIYPELVLDKVTNPAEVGADFPDAPIEPAIYKQLRGKHNMLIGLANDEIGYILPKRQWDEKPPFCYGLTKAPYGEINSLGSETGPIICRVFRELAK